MFGQEIIKMDAKEKQHKKRKRGVEVEEEDRGYMRWNIEMERTLADVLRDQRNLGNKGDGGWKKCATKVASSILSARFQRDISVDNIRNRIKTWKKYYAVVTDMLSQSGFNWDDNKKMISIDEESIWEEYIKSHKDAVPFRWRVIPNWDDIADLCGKDTTIREGAETIADANEMTEESTDVHHVSATQDFEDALVIEDTFACLSNSRRKRGKSSSGSIVPSQKKKTISLDTLASTMANMANSLEKYMQLITQKLDPNEVYDEINRVEDLGEVEQLKACMWFIENEKQYLMLKALPPEKKKRYILMVLSKAT